MTKKGWLAFHAPLLNFVSVVAESSENGPLYPVCLLNFEIVSDELAGVLFVG